jgi:hypothetical protein
MCTGEHRRGLAAPMLDWLLGKRFDPPSPPLRDFWATIEVSLTDPYFVEGKPPADAYLRILGVRCTPIRIPSLLAEQVADGAVVKGKNTHWHEISLNQLSRSLRGSITVTNAECVWHLSGRIYFPSSSGA